MNSICIKIIYSTDWNVLFLLATTTPGTTTPTTTLADGEETTTTTTAAPTTTEFIEVVERRPDVVCLVLDVSGSMGVSDRSVVND